MTNHAQRSVMPNPSESFWTRLSISFGIKVKHNTSKGFDLDTKTNRIQYGQVGSVRVVIPFDLVLTNNLVSFCERDAFVTVYAKRECMNKDRHQTNCQHYKIKQ